MSDKLTLLVAGIIIGAVGGLLFFGGTQLMGRQKSGGVMAVGSCLLAIVGAVVIFVGLGAVIGAFFLP